MVRGTAKPKDKVLLGPDSNGKFIQTQIKTIHFKKMITHEARSGHFVCFSLRNVNRSKITRGMVLIDPETKERGVWEFEAQMDILHSRHTTIKVNYEPILHIHNITQTARIKKIVGKTTLRSGDSAKVTFRFRYRPAFIQINDNFVFREGHICGIGTVTVVPS